jgi:hypothetical protein
MHIQFIKNIQFTKVLKVHLRLREFNFLKHKAEPSSYFSVDTVDDRGNRIAFSMFDIDGKWRIKEIPGLPDWIYDAETLFHTSIVEENQ